jgi:hypothetical protein
MTFLSRSLITAVGRAVHLVLTTVTPKHARTS